MNPESWQILGINPSTPINQVKLRFRQLALQHHPDKGGSPFIFQQIKNAYRDILTFHSNLKQKSFIDLKKQSKECFHEQSQQQYKYKGYLNPDNLNIDKFNSFFIQHRLEDDNGYGHLMESSSNHREEDSEIYKTKIKPFADQQLILYQEPANVFNCTANVGHLGEDTTNFTSAWNSKTQYTDYVEAHSKPVDINLIPQRESYQSIDQLKNNRDKPLIATKQEQKYIQKMQKKKEKEEKNRMSRLHTKDTLIQTNYQKIHNLLGIKFLYS